MTEDKRARAAQEADSDSEMRSGGEESRNAGLNEQRLAALYALCRMENASETELLRFALTSVMQLTDSEDGFFFLPDRRLKDKGLFLVSEGHREIVGNDSLPEDRLPDDVFALVDGDLERGLLKTVWNGTDETPRGIRGGKISFQRYLLCPVYIDDRPVCLVGVCDKKTPYDDGDMRQVETFARNAWSIVRRHRLFHELRKAKEAAEAASGTKDKFLANINHELRTPLNGIVGMLHLLQQSLLPDELKELVNGAHDSATTLVKIISDILDFSRLASDKMELASDSFDLTESLLACAVLFRKKAESKGLSLQMTLDPRIPGLVVGDDARVRQIACNLLDNAVKFTETGGITVTCTLLVPEDQMREWGKVLVELSVSDTGIGIPPDRHNLVFEPFVKADNALDKRHPGSGLGLNLVQTLARMMGGRVNLVSGENSGTTVSCTLLFTLPEEAETAPDLPLATAHADPAYSLDILVAEDDAVSRTAIARFLERSGHRTFCVADGNEALEAMRAYPFDCLFTDIMMPGMDGIELAKRIRENATDDEEPGEEMRKNVEAVFPNARGTPYSVDPDCIIVAVSAHMIKGDEQFFLEQGFDYCLAKPLAAQELHNVLKQIALRNTRVG